MTWLLYFAGAATALYINFQDFPGPENFRKEIQDFPGGVGTLGN